MNKAVIDAPEDRAVIDDKQADADLDAGFATADSSGTRPAPQAEGQPRDDAGRFAAQKSDAEPKSEPKTKTDKKPADKPSDKPGDAVVEKPEYVQITKQQLNQFLASAKRTEDSDKQLSKVFGTIGDMQKIMRTLQAQTPRGAAVKIPADAFAAMEKDFPELAQHTRAALEATLKGIEGTGSASVEIDTEAFNRKLEERVLKLAAEDLEDVYPDWQKIVGAVDISKGEKPDPNNPFRKWLATKDKSCQDRINGTNSAGVITRAIRAFKSETKAQPVAAKPIQRGQTRASRIREAIQPRGDGGQPPVKSADDEFEAGFRSG